MIINHFPLGFFSLVWYLFIKILPCNSVSFYVECFLLYMFMAELMLRLTDYPYPYAKSYHLGLSHRFFTLKMLCCKVPDTAYGRHSYFESTLCVILFVCLFACVYTKCVYHRLPSAEIYLQIRLPPGLYVFTFWLYHRIDFAILVSILFVSIFLENIFVCMGAFR